MYLVFDILVLFVLSFNIFFLFLKKKIDYFNFWSKIFLMKEDTLLGVIQKVRTVRFRNFRRPSPLYLHIRCSLPFSTSVRVVFFKEDMTKIYLANYYKSKNLKKRYKIKKQLHKANGKCQIKTPTRALGTSLGMALLFPSLPSLRTLRMTHY